MTNTYSILGIAGKMTAPGVWEFKGENWHAVLTEWGHVLKYEKPSWSLCLFVGHEHSFEVLHEDPGEAIASIERHVVELFSVLSRIVVSRLPPALESICWRCRYVRDTGHCGAPAEAGPCSEEERELFKPA